MRVIAPRAALCKGQRILICAFAVSKNGILFIINAAGKIEKCIPPKLQKNTHFPKKLSLSAFSTVSIIQNRSIFVFEAADS